MEIKFERNINDFSYILGFDLAKKVSGYSLISIPTYEVLATGLITTQDENPWAEMLEKLNQILTNIEKIPVNKQKLLVVKERMPNQGGTKSTINTLQELAKVHAIFDLWCQQNEFYIYDYNGVHSTTVKSFIKTFSGIEKPSKEDIAACLSQLLNNPNIKTMDLNITDSIAVAVSLVYRKWNSDLDKEISILKKNMKKYKLEKKREELMQRIIHLQKLKKEDIVWGEAQYITQDQ